MGLDELLKGFPVVTHIPVAWGEMDSFGHINNVYYFRYFESARMTYFEQAGFMEHMQTSGIGPILASAQCRFRVPLAYPDTVSVGMRVHTIESDRFVMDCRVVSNKLEKVAAEGSSVVVMYDYRQNTKALLPDSLRQRMEELAQSTL